MFAEGITYTKIHQIELHGLLINCTLRENEGVRNEVIQVTT